MSLGQFHLQKKKKKKKKKLLLYRAYAKRTSKIIFKMEILNHDTHEFACFWSMLR